MAGENGKRQISQDNRLTHAQFFKLCEELRNRREIFLQERPSQAAAAKQLSEWLKFPVGPGSVATAQEATGVTWETKTNRVGQDAKVRKARMRTICKQIVIVCRQLGMNLEDEFLDMVQEMYGEGHGPAIVQQAINERERLRSLVAKTGMGSNTQAK